MEKEYTVLTMCKNVVASPVECNENTNTAGPAFMPFGKIGGNGN